jgi:hypothetical protein
LKFFGCTAEPSAYTVLLKLYELVNMNHNAAILVTDTFLNALEDQFIEQLVQRCAKGPEVDPDGSSWFLGFADGPKSSLEKIEKPIFIPTQT